MLKRSRSALLQISRDAPNRTAGRRRIRRSGGALFYVVVVVVSAYGKFEAVSIVEPQSAGFVSVAERPSIVDDGAKEHIEILRHGERRRDFAFVGAASSFDLNNDVLTYYSVRKILSDFFALLAGPHNWRGQQPVSVEQAWWERRRSLVANFKASVRCFDYRRHFSVVSNRVLDEKLSRFVVLFDPTYAEYKNIRPLQLTERGSSNVDLRGGRTGTIARCIGRSFGGLRALSQETNLLAHLVKLNLPTELGGCEFGFSMFKLTLASEIKADCSGSQPDCRESQNKGENGEWITRRLLPKGFAFVCAAAGLCGGLVTSLLLSIGRIV
jgi:hypothetical protein